MTVCARRYVDVWVVGEWGGMESFDAVIVEGERARGEVLRMCGKRFGELGSQIRMQVSADAHIVNKKLFQARRAAPSSKLQALSPNPPPLLVSASIWPASGCSLPLSPG